MPIDNFPDLGEPTFYIAQPFGGLDPAQMDAFATYYYEYPLLYASGDPTAKLAPGMYTEVKWPAKSGQVTLLVPATAVTSNTERSFVIRIENGLTKYVNVRKGAPQGDLVEVVGPLAAGDLIIQRATDEIREGTRVSGS